MSFAVDPDTTPTFTIFPRLPIELRFKIWESASMATRTLELVYRFSDKRFSTLQPVPAVLRTCQESRRVGTRIYRLSFGTTKFPPRTYFNPISDIVYFGLRVYDDEVAFMLRFFRKHGSSFENEDQIQRLALAEHLWRVDREGSLFPPWRSGRTAKKIERFHESFPRLKELIFVTGQDETESEDDIEEPWQTNDGVSLIKCRSDLAAEQQLAQEAVITTFEARQKEFPDEDFPEVTFVEYGF